MMLGTTNIKNLREFDITVREKTKSLRKEPCSRFEDEVDFIQYRRASYIPKLFPCRGCLSILKYIRSRIQLRGNYLNSGVVSLATIFVKMSHEHYVQQTLDLFFLLNEGPIFVAKDKDSIAAVLIDDIH